MWARAFGARACRGSKKGQKPLTFVLPFVAAGIHHDEVPSLHLAKHVTYLRDGALLAFPLEVTGTVKLVSQTNASLFERSHITRLLELPELCVLVGAPRQPTCGAPCLDYAVLQKPAPSVSAPVVELLKKQTAGGARSSYGSPAASRTV